MGWPTKPMCQVAPESPSNIKMKGRVWVLNLDMIESNSGNIINKVFEDSGDLNSVAAFDEGNVLFSKLRPYLNKVTIPDGKGYATTELVPLRPNTEELRPYFLSFLLRTDEFVKYADGIATGTKMPRMPMTALREFKCILPPTEQQDKFCGISKRADKSKFAGFKSQFIEMFGNPMVEMQKYPLKKLGDCCVINPKRSKIALTDPDPVSFVPMPSVSEEGYLQDVSDAEYGSVKKGFTYFENGDVLFAKITPCMENGKGAIAHDLTNGVGMGSTEFHVLRPIKGISNSYWLLTLTRLPEFRDRAAHNMSGTGGQQRVRADFLENFMIGLPPIEKQKELENVCRVADKSKYLN
jgi:type I restriction enzyme S subunit